MTDTLINNTQNLAMSEGDGYVAPQPVVCEPLCGKELARLAKVGAIATDESGKVVMWPVFYRNQMVGRFMRGWREAEKYHGITQKGGQHGADN